MKSSITSLLLAPVAVLALGGCAVGYNTVLFTTKTNVGVDVDGTPPTMEVSVARREGVIEPTFAGGATPPVVASFRYDNGALPFFAGISSTFAGGDAAVILSDLYANPSHAQMSSTDKQNYVESSAIDSSILLPKAPSKTVLGRTLTLNAPCTMQPFTFGTDTLFGLKVGWSGQTASYPDTVKLGYNRKELAIAPIFVEQVSGGTSVRVKMASFFASADTAAQLASMGNSTVSRQQYFATGKAADYLVIQLGSSNALAKKIDVTTQTLIQQEKSQIDCILAYVGTTTVDGTKLATLAKGTGLPQGWLDAYSGKPAADLRTDLTGAHAGSVPALAANIPAQ